MKSEKRHKILGVRIDAMTIEEGISETLRLAKEEKPAMVIKPYVEFMTAADSNRNVKELLNKADLALPDGIALIWAGHYLYSGQRNLFRLFYSLISIFLQPKKITSVFPDRFGGINFTWPLLAQCEKEGLKVALIGSPKYKDIEHTARTIQRAYPQLKIAMTFHGRIDSAAEKELLEKLIRTKPDIILVGTGFPRQEQLIQSMITKVKKGVFIGEGGTFDYSLFGGRKPRAPRIMQKAGLEWLWRLILEPSRIKRQLAIPKFIYLIYKSR